MNSPPRTRASVGRRPYGALKLIRSCQTGSQRRLGLAKDIPLLQRHKAASCSLVEFELCARGALGEECPVAANHHHQHGHKCADAHDSPHGPIIDPRAVEVGRFLRSVRQSVAAASIGRVAARESLRPATRRAAKQERQGRREAASERSGEAPDQRRRMNSPPRTRASVSPEGSTERSN